MSMPGNESGPVATSRPRPKLLRLSILVVVVLIVAGIIWLRPREFTPRSAPLSDVLAPSPVALAPGVYVLGKCAPAAVYLIETSEGLVLVDSGIEANAVGVLEQLAELRFDVKALKA